MPTCRTGVGAASKGCSTTLVWVNVMRLKQDQRHQMLYAAHEDDFAMLQHIADGCRSGKRLIQAECEYLNEFSQKIHDKMKQDGFREMCDFCDTEYATREVSKQTVLPFRDIHAMQNGNSSNAFQCYGRPKLTFHDQIWSCCSSAECFVKFERAHVEQTARLYNSGSNFRQPTSLSQCNTCQIECGSFKCCRCRSAVYCSKECQRAAWPLHKKSCKQVAATSDEPIDKPVKPSKT